MRLTGILFSMRHPEENVAYNSRVGKVEQLSVAAA